MDQKALSVEHLMTEERSFPPSKEFSKKAHLKTEQEYELMYRRSIHDPDKFWLEQTETLEWFQKPTIAGQHAWDTKAGVAQHRWFSDGVINVSSNCLDRHLSSIGNKAAIIWQGERDEETRTLTYNELHAEVCRFANVLKSRGIVKGDRVCIYLPMIPELAIVMLACARIGAVHSIVFAGFSAESISHRINDSSCKMVITANEGIRGGKTIPLKEIVDEALIRCDSVEKVIVVKRTETSCKMDSARDVWYHDEMQHLPSECEAEPLEAEHTLFILYTSGSTGKPKGVVHTQAGYLLYASLTHKYIFDSKPKDVYWCTADIGWVTGHSYVIYGPLTNGATTLMFEGTPTYPDAGRFWQIVEKHNVSTFYTAPTAIRALIQCGETFPKKYDLSSLRLLGTVGEPINPEAWMWYHEVVGKGKCPIVDTWWQTETGGVLISALPGVHTIKPGSATRPFFGIEPVVLRDDGTECGPDEGGSLCIKRPWPGIMRTTWGDHQRFVDTYFSQFDHMYFTGDSCRVDPDGDYWLMGRVDDVVNVSGHRIGTAEVESALVSFEAVAEAAVVPVPDAVKGQGLYAFVTLVTGVEATNDLRKELLLHVRREIGAIAVPNKIQFAQGLPKTRSGKIMRRILRKIACKESDDLGDVSTLADPSIVDELTKKRGENL